MSELTTLFVKGLGIGLAMAAPVGPVGALCIRKAINTGKTAAILSGMGAATADAFYGAVAAFGLTVISGFLVQYQQPATAVGGIFLLWLAWKFVSTANRTATATDPAKGTSLLSGYVTTFLLTMTNPTTILSFIAIFAGIGFVGASDTASAMLLVSGVFLGSTLWWIILAFLSTELQKRFGARFTYLVNITSALIIGLFGAAALVSLFF